jgi:hypothetical protein
VANVERCVVKAERLRQTLVAETNRRLERMADFRMNQLRVSFDNSGRIIGSDLRGRQSYLAAGETQLLGMVLITVLQELTSKSKSIAPHLVTGPMDALPIVLDSPFGCLDSQHQQTAIDLLLKIGGQKLVVLSPHQLELFSRHQGFVDCVGTVSSLTLHERGASERSIQSSSFSFGGHQGVLLETGTDFGGTEIRLLFSSGLPS